MERLGEWLLGQWRLVSLLIVWISIVVLSTLMPSHALAQPSRAQETKDLDQAIKLLNGTWRLKQRTNPDGAVQPRIVGVTVISLKAFPPRFGLASPRALGTITAQESGVHDPRCTPCVPREFLGKPFQIESTGTWAVRVLPPNHAKFKAAGIDFYIEVLGATNVSGNYTPYADGMNMNVAAYYRITRGRNSLTLMNDVGLSHFAGSPPETNAGEPIEKELLDKAACNCTGLIVQGDLMTIKWSYGGEDQWTRSR